MIEEAGKFLLTDPSFPYLTHLFFSHQSDLITICRGDYVCDDIVPGNRQNQPHVAAWDAPGMDFLSEEQTLKYLNRSNSTEQNLKSPSVATTAELVDEAPSPSGSLPECEQNQSSSSRIKLSESNFNNPTFHAGSTRHSSESKSEDNEEGQEQVTKASNIL